VVAFVAATVQRCDRADASRPGEQALSGVTEEFVKLHHKVELPRFRGSSENLMKLGKAHAE
jgi:hypothetical protein